MSLSIKTTYEQELEESKKQWKYLLHVVETADCPSNVGLPSSWTHSYPNFPAALAPRWGRTPEFRLVEWEWK